MKKLILLTSLFLIIGCSSTEDRTIEETSIFGTWLLEKRLENNIEITLNSCQTTNTSLEFFGDFSLFSNVGFMDENECIVDQFSYQFEVENNTLIISGFSGEQLTFQSKSDIMQLDSEVLKLKTFYLMELVGNQTIVENIPDNERITEQYIKQ